MYLEYVYKNGGFLTVDYFSQMRHSLYFKALMTAIILTTSTTGSLECLPNLFKGQHSWLCCCASQNIPSLFSLTWQNGTSYSDFGYATDIILASLFTMSKFGMLLFYGVCDMGIIVLVVSFWDMVHDFSVYCHETVSKHSRLSTIHFALREILNGLVHIRSFSELINEALQFRLILYLADASVYYPMNFFSIFSNGNEYFRVHFIIGFIFMCVIILGAAKVKADVSNIMEDTVIELYEKDFRPDQSEIFLMQTLQEAIGVSCNKYFQVTFSFVGNVSIFRTNRIFINVLLSKLVIFCC